MICDDCKYRDKCNKIISESATDCVDKSENRLVVLPNSKFRVYYSSNTYSYKNMLSASEMAQIMKNLLQGG